MTKRLTLDEIIKVATWWKDSGGSCKVEVAALEPTLWKDNEHNISDVVKQLKDLDFTVSITTNGALLSKHSESLKKAGLDLLRISWHSLNDDTFKKITGGGILKNVRHGIISSIDCGLNVKINRVLLKNYTDDIVEQVKFIDDYKIKLKLLDLYWTPSSASFYEKYYISPQEVISENLQKVKLDLVKDIEHNGRKRVTYRTNNGGIVEYKIKESAEKNHEYCNNCTFKDDCLEGYGDYFRVFPDSTASLCYLRKDLATRDYKSIFRGNKTPLRFVLEGRCNFNCGFPDSTVSWCLKQSRDFKFPSRDGVIKFEHKR